MQAKNILQADLLDILFENRNKSYGAYDLRKTYNKRLVTALGLMTVICSVFVFGTLFAGGRKTGPVIESKVFELLPDVPKEKEPDPVVEEPAAAPPAPPAQLEQIRMVANTAPQIVVDALVNPDNQVQTVDVIEDARIGTFNADGVDDPGNSAPVLNPGTGTGGNGTSLTGHGKDVMDEGIMVTVQVEARFPGGTEAWRRFLEKNLNRDAPVENGAQPGSKLTVVVSFVVDKEGNVSEVRAENDPGFGTAEEAVRVIKRGPKWIPAIQNGRNVMYRQRQSVTFQVSEE